MGLKQKADPYEVGTGFVSGEGGIFRPSLMRLRRRLRIRCVSQQDQPGAEGEGFEPSWRFWRQLALQASRFSRSRTLPKNFSLNILQNRYIINGFFPSDA